MFLLVGLQRNQFFSSDRNGWPSSKPFLTFTVEIDCVISMKCWWDQRKWSLRSLEEKYEVKTLDRTIKSKIIFLKIISKFSNVVLEKAMAPHSSNLAWKIPWTEEPGSLQSMGSLRVRHDWVTLLSLFSFMHCRGKWQPTPVFLPGESRGRGSLVGFRLWDRTESDTTEAT